MPLFLVFIIFNNHSNSTIIHSFTRHHSPRPVFLYPHRFLAQQEKNLHGVPSRAHKGWPGSGRPTDDTRQLVLPGPRHSVGTESTCDEEQREWPGSGRPPDDTRQLVLPDPRHSVPGTWSTCDEEQREWPGSGRPPDDIRQLVLPGPRHMVLKVPVMKSRENGQSLDVLLTTLDS